MTPDALGLRELPLFVLSGLLLNLTPGADSLFIVARSAGQGLRAGIAAALGIGAGCLVHVLAGALGLSAILATSGAAFAALKLAGAAYLVWIGVGLLRAGFAAPAPAVGEVAPAAPARFRAVFAQGLLTNVLNPKVALFFLAFVPQFIAPEAPDKALAFAALGAVFAFNGTLWCLFLAWSAARVGAAGVGRKTARWLARGTGALFVVLGVRLALAQRG